MDGVNNRKFFISVDAAGEAFNGSESSNSSSLSSVGMGGVSQAIYAFFNEALPRPSAQKEEGITINEHELVSKIEAGHAVYNDKYGSRFNNRIIFQLVLFMQLVLVIKIKPKKPFSQQMTGRYY